MTPLIFLSDGQKLSLRAYGLIILLCMCFFLPGFFTIPPVDRDEPHFAQATKQMVETNNYIDIRYKDETRYKKPIGIYWLQAASVKFFSPNNLTEIWPYRIPSLIGATVATVMTAALGSLFFGPMAGFIAALMMMSSILLNVEARLAKTDAALLACIVTAQYALAKAYKSKDHSEKTVQTRTNAIIFWTAQGLAFLIKGPILFLITASTLGTIWLSNRKRQDKQASLSWLKTLYPFWGVFCFLLLVAPWFIAITNASNGAFIQASAGHDLLAKIWQGQDRGVVAPGLHLLAMPAVFFPFSIILLFSIPDVWRNRRTPNVLFCLGWIVLPWIVFELSLTKLPHYVLPMYPALAILSAKTMLDGFPVLAESAWRKAIPLLTGVWFMVGCGIIGGAMFASHAINGTIPPYLMLLGLLLITAQSVFLLSTLRKQIKGTAMLTGCMLLLNTALFQFVLPHLDNLWISKQIVETAKQANNCTDLELDVDSYNEPSLIFLAGAQTKILNGGLAVGNDLKRNHCFLSLIPEKHKQSFLDATINEPVFPVKTFAGYNLGSGRMVSLTLYKYVEPNKEK